MGRNEKVPEVREAMFQWFIDVGVSLKRCLLMKMFYPKCVQVYSQWLKKTQKNTLLSFWKKSKSSVSTSSINTAEQTEPDVEILPACQEAKSSNQGIVASSSSSLKQQLADPGSSSSNTTGTFTCVHIYSARKYVQRKNCCYTTLKQHNTMHTKRLT